MLLFLLEENQIRAVITMCYGSLEAAGKLDSHMNPKLSTLKNSFFTSCFEGRFNICQS